MQQLILLIFKIGKQIYLMDYQVKKTPISLLEISKLLNINSNSEFHTTLGTMLFGSGIAYGYKYYLKDKSSQSLFFNIGQHISFLGTFEDGFIAHGTNIATGFCILQKNGYYTYRETFAGRLKHKPYKKSSLNIGISFVYFHSDKSKCFYPFINWQKVLPK